MAQKIEWVGSEVTTSIHAPNNKAENPPPKEHPNLNFLLGDFNVVEDLVDRVPADNNAAFIKR